MIDHRTFKYIERMFYEYQDSKENYDTYRDAIINGSSGPADGMPRGSGVSDPTMSKVIKLDKLEDKMLKIQVVDETLFKFKDHDIVDLIRLKYFEKKGRIHICMKLNISESCFYLWREKVIHYAAFKAIKNDLIEI